MTQKQITEWKHDGQLMLKGEQIYKENLPKWLRIQIKLYEKWKTKKLKQISWNEL